MIKKLDKPITSEEVCEALMEIRNTPRADGVSPNEILFGRPIRTLVPMHHSAFKPRWQEIADEIDQRRTELSQKIENHYNLTARDHKPLRIGEKVRIQDHMSKKWNKVGEIVSVGKYRDYCVKMPSGRSTRRNRRFLRRFHEASENETDDEAGSSSERSQADPGKQKNEDGGSRGYDAGEKQQPSLRRSERAKKLTVRFKM